jgi:regulator of extracellular matrix RemA (YlzA/DUF370 family)
MASRTIISIGYGNYINPKFIKEILEPGSARWKKVKAWASGKRKFVDTAAGDKARCIIYMTSGHAILSSLSCDLVKERIREIFPIIIKDS